LADFFRTSGVQAPDWFNEFVAKPRVSRTIDVQGAPIHYDTWMSSAENPGLLFVHGNGAHSHWWDFIAPAFTNDFNVMAIDLSGAGDSGHREHYSAANFANEIIEVVRAAGFSRTIIAGHSFGGGMTRIAGYLYGDELGGIVLIDSGISNRRGNRMPPTEPRPHTRFYESLEAAKKRFRLRPPQPCENDYILDYIAEYSIRETERGFRYKLDQSMFAKMTQDRNLDFPDAVSLIRAITCPVGFIYGEQSRFFEDAESIETVKSVIPANLLHGIPNAHHHVFLDQPLAFIDTLRELLARLPG